MLTFTIGRTPQVTAGPGCRAGFATPETLPKRGRILLITDQGIMNSGLVAQTLELWGRSDNLKTHVLPSQEPTIDLVSEVAAQARERSPQMIVGLGGGSVLDTTKLVAALCTTTEPLSNFLLGEKHFPGKVPSLLLPTTAGTGAEISRTCVVSNDEGRKLWAWDDRLLPDAVLLDPELTTSLPPGLSIAAGIDALAHAMEAATARRRNLMVLPSALTAIQLVLINLPLVLEKPNDLQARGQMQIAACLAGWAINNCGTGIAHNLAHALGSLVHVPHGLAVGLALAVTLEWSVAGDPLVYEPVATCFGPDVTPETLPQAFATFLTSIRFGPLLDAMPRPVVEPTKLAAEMQLSPNYPMAENNVRIPATNEFLMLAQRMTEIWN